LAVKELLCFDQWLLVINRDDTQYNLPDCHRLPSKYEINSSCVDSHLFVRKDEEVTSKYYSNSWIHEYDTYTRVLYRLA